MLFKKQTTGLFSSTTRHQQQQKSFRSYTRVINPQKIEAFRFTFMWTEKKFDKERLIVGTLLTNLEL